MTTVVKINKPHVECYDLMQFMTNALYVAVMIPICVAKCLFIHCRLPINLVSFDFSYSSLHQLRPHTVKR